MYLDYPDNNNDIPAILAAVSTVAYASNQRKHHMTTEQIQPIPNVETRHVIIKDKHFQAIVNQDLKSLVLRSTVESASIGVGDKIVIESLNLVSEVTRIRHDSRTQRLFSYE